MNNLLEKINKGLEYTFEKTVLPEDSAIKYDSGLIDVFSTPSMLAFMESSSYQLVQNLLPQGYTTVGTEANIRHLKATAINKKVKCNVKLIKVEDKKLTFEVKTWDEEGLIGEGIHKRHIINIENFINKLHTKTTT